MRARIAGVLFLLALASTPAFVQDHQTLILEHANIVDLLSGQPLPDQTIVLTGSRILSVSQAPAVMPGERIDLRGAWVLPGLIDAHIHVETIAQARSMLSLGVTAGRSALTRNYADVGLRSLHNRGDVDIPTILAAGYPVVACPVKLKPDLSALFLDHPSLDDLRNLGRVGPEGARRIVRANAGRKVDWIKVFANERGGLPETDPSTRNLNDEELMAAVNEATLLDLPTQAHAYSDEGVIAAVTAGVRSIEHGSLITEPTLKLMRDRGVYFVPTLSPIVMILSPDAPAEVLPLRARARMLAENSRRAIFVAKRLGVSIVAGADTSYDKGGSTVIEEIIQLASAGLSNLEAIGSATAVAADCLKMSAAKGTLEPGKDADLVAYASNPVNDLTALRKPILVINEGKIFLRKLPSNSGL